MLNNNFAMVETEVMKKETAILSLDIETNQKWRIEKLEVPEPLVADDLEEELVEEAMQYNLFQTWFVYYLKLETRHYSGKIIPFKTLRRARERTWESCIGEGMSEELLNKFDCQLMQGISSEACPYRCVPNDAEMNLAGVMITNAETMLSATSQKQLLDYLTKLPESKKPNLSEGFHMFTNLDDVNKLFVAVEKAHKNRKQSGTALIVAHNASYEWNMLLKKLPYMQEAVKTNRFTAMRGNAANTIKGITIWEKPVITEEDENNNHKILQVVDSFLYKRKSLKEIGKGFGFPKDVLDYETFFEPLQVQQAINARCAGKPKQGDYNHLLDYNRIDCTIPFAILHESLANHYALLTGGDYRPGYPISANHIQGIIQQEEGRRLWELYMRDDDGNIYGSTIVNQQTTYISKDGKVRKSKSLTEQFQAKNKEWALDENEFDLVHKVAGGGLVGMNPCVASKIIDLRGKETAIKHIDLVSAHPSQVFKRMFPSGLPLKVDGNQLNYILKLLRANMGLRKRIKNPCKAFSRLVGIYGKELGLRSGYYSGFATFQLKNIKIKEFAVLENNCMIPAMPFHKIRKDCSGNCIDGITVVDSLNAIQSVNEIQQKYLKGESKNLVISNKVFCLESLEISATFEELLLWSMFYDFEIVTATEMRIYKMQACPEFLYYCFRSYADRKEAYKKITDMQKNARPESEIIDFLNNNKDKFFETDYNYLVANPLDVKFAKNALLLVKGIFNGIYGQNYQSNKHKEAVYAVENGVIVEREVLSTYKASQNRNYLVSVYIALWSKVDLALHLAYVLSRGGCPLYWATDSIFYIDSKQNPAIPFVNGKHVNLFNEQTTYLQNWRPQSPIAPLGGMDLEEDNIVRFCTTQSLRNIFECETGGGRLTFSGCSEEILFGEPDDDGFYDFDKISKIFTTKDLYVSPFRNHKSSKEVTEDGTYCLKPQGFVLNGSSTLDYVLKQKIAG